MLVVAVMQVATDQLNRRTPLLQEVTTDRFWRHGRELQRHRQPVGQLVGHRSVAMLAVLPLQLQQHHAALATVAVLMPGEIQRP